EGEGVSVMGASGGSRIIAAVLQVITNVIDGGRSIAEAVAAPRMHHQWMPDEVVVERGFAPDLIRALGARGHLVREDGRWSSVNSIATTAEGLVGAADTRTRGALAAGY